MKIAIIGGGNIGTLMAAEMAATGHEIVIFTSKPEQWSREIEVLDNDSNILLTGILSKVTSDLGEAVSGAELIWITFPAEMFPDFGRKLKEYICPGQMIGVVPGSGGAEFAFEDILKKGGILFGLQRVHSIARIERYGKSVRMLGRKDRLELASIPASECNRICVMVEDLLKLPCIPLPNYMCVTLTPSNPILHTSRLYAMFKNYKPGMVYPKNFLFYEEWDDLSSEILIECDKELQELCKSIPLDLTHVVSLKEYYESPDVEAMTKKIRSIKAFKGLTSPMVECRGGWKPDFTSRYFSADYAFGLKVLRDIAKKFDVATPRMDILWDWYTEMVPSYYDSVFKLNTDQKTLISLYK